MTLLELTQAILSSMDSDEVNSINDTTESKQVALAIKMAYNDIISRSNLPSHFDMFELNASVDVTKPTIMTVPDGIQSVLWIKYDKKAYADTDADYQKVSFLEPAAFVELQNVLKTTDTNVIRFNVSRPNSSTIELAALQNKHPDYYTVWDNSLVVFDSYDETVDSTLQKNKTLCYGEVESTFTMSDAFVPDLEPNQFSLLFNEAKALCHAELKQIEHVKAEKNAKRAWNSLHRQKNKFTNPSFFDTLPNYGRK